MNQIAKRLCLAVATTWIAGWSAAASAGNITLIERESRGSLGLFAGSGGAVDQYINDDLKTDLTGGFSFSDAWSVAIDESDQYSLGTANASGSISISDNVAQYSPQSLVLTATRSASGDAAVISGASNANSTEGQTFRVRFTTGADPVNYTLVGDFDPGAVTGIIGEAGTISLRRPFTASQPILIQTATSGIYETGTLPANQTWELFVRMNDKPWANATTPFGADASSLNLSFTVTSVPEPTSALMLLAGAVVLGVRFKRCRPT